MAVPAQFGTGKLLSVLGVTFGLAVGVGNTIGAGILRSPGTIASNLPEFLPFLSVWLIGGLYALLGANAISELATMVPRAGGQYAFVRRGLGDYAGFVVGWSDWVSTCGTTAALAIVIGEYTVGLVPELRSYHLVALVAIGALTVVQWIGIRTASATQNVTSLIKAVVLLAFVAACFFMGSRNPFTADVTADREGFLLVAFIVSLQAVIYTYDGWTAPIYFSEEFKDPGRQLPRAIFGGLFAVIVIYLLIILAFATVVPLPTLAGKDLAIAAVSERLFGMHADTVVRLVMVLALLSALTASLMMAPRVVFAMSRDGLFWRGATEVNQGGTPDVALLVSSVLGGLFIISGSFENVIAKLAFFFVANYTLSFITLFVLRRREPETARPYRAWGHPFTTGLALVASIIFLIGVIATDTVNSLWAIGLLFLSYPAYRLTRR